MDKIHNLYERSPMPGYVPRNWENRGVSKEYKYIMVEDEDGKMIPVIFGASLSHKAVILGIQQGLRREARDGGSGSKFVTPVSAGFVEGLSVSRVHGHSESMQFGFGHFPKELCEAHPETDLPIINRGRSAETIANDKATDIAQAKAALEIYIGKILKKEAPEARHKSPAGRWDAAISYVQGKGYPLDRAKSLVARVAAEQVPGAYKIP